MVNSRRRIHTVFFDAGGTLVDSPPFFEYFAMRVAPDLVERIAPVMQRRFLAMLRDETLPFAPVKALLACVIAEICAEFGLPDQSDRAAQYYRELFTQEATLYDDVLECLGRLRATGKRLIIVSDADADVLHAELEHFGIHDYFDNFVISSDVRGYKPGRAMAEAAAAFCPEPRSGAVFVGDEAVDVLTARKMGVGVVIVRNSRGEELGADYVLGSLSELFSVIE